MHSVVGTAPRVSVLAIPISAVEADQAFIGEGIDLANGVGHSKAHLERIGGHLDHVWDGIDANLRLFSGIAPAHELVFLAAQFTSG